MADVDVEAELGLLFEACGNLQGTRAQHDRLRRAHSVVLGEVRQAKEWFARLNKLQAEIDERVEHAAKRKAAAGQKRGRPRKKKAVDRGRVLQVELAGPGEG